jgi:hypothetical protein
VLSDTLSQLAAIESAIPIQESIPLPVFREGDDAKVIDELIFSIEERLAVAAATAVAQKRDLRSASRGKVPS